MIDYDNLISLNDSGSAILGKIKEATFGNNKYARKIGDNLTVLDIPEDHLVVVHSTMASGHMREMKDIQSYTTSLVKNLVKNVTSWRHKIIPIAFANVIDASKGDLEEVREIGRALLSSANEHKLVMVGGELAILGNRVTGIANISGTMIGIIPKKGMEEGTWISDPYADPKARFVYSVFDPQGKPVYVNSDGVGTKLEFGERIGDISSQLYDATAMLADDAVKIGAKIEVIHEVVEYSHDINLGRLDAEAFKISKQLGIQFLLQPQKAEGKIQSYKEGVSAYNISGSCISVIEDEEMLKNPFQPRAGDSLIAIKANGPRSNGITARRQLMEKLYGQEWHTTEEGKKYLEFLSRPSIIFYDVFRKLLQDKTASCVFHMSGGSFDGKLARLLARQNLFVQLNNLFQPDKREIEMAERSGMSAESAYRAWPMGVEGFISTNNPTSVLGRLQHMYDQPFHEARVVGVIQEAEDKTGVEFVADNWDEVYFSGQNLDPPRRTGLPDLKGLT